MLSSSRLCQGLLGEGEGMSPKVGGVSYSANLNGTYQSSRVHLAFSHAAREEQK